MAQALKEKALQIGILEQEVQQLQLLLELHKVLILNSKQVLGVTPLLKGEADLEDPQVVEEEEEDHQEDLGVQVAIHLEHQDLKANNQLLDVTFLGL